MTETHGQGERDIQIDREKEEEERGGGEERE